MPIPVIDLFAGPGGLAEGFSSLVDRDGERIFDVKLSIEKDATAHETLKLRSFVRQFDFRNLPLEYYQFIRGEITIAQLYETYPKQHRSADNEAWLATLGETPPDEVDARIRRALNGRRNWALIGGPPCQAYSNVGRSRVGGIFETDHRVFLYKEYLRIIANHHPAVFVMENVEGLLSAKVNGEKVFDWILRDLSDPSTVFGTTNAPKYRIVSLVKETIDKDSDYLIKAENYGVPQRRHRVILLGIREDINRIPSILTVQDKVSLKSVIGRLPKIRSGISRSYSHSENVVDADGVTKKRRRYKKEENTFENWLQKTEVFRREIIKRLKIEGLEPNVRYPKSTGIDFLETNAILLLNNHPLADWYLDNNIQGVIHHISRSHLLQDLKRYLFAALYTQVNDTFPRLHDYKAFDKQLLPDHENVDSGKFTDRFRVQLPDRPATTITSHISKDGHYFIHYDQVQCRSLTVREAARIQTFPDNYFFCGSRTEQFHQVGNAVPPYLAYQIAEVVKGVFGL